MHHNNSSYEDCVQFIIILLFDPIVWEEKLAS